MAIYIATGKVVKVSVGGTGGNRVARLVNEGGVIPDGVSEEQLERLESRGLIALVETTDAEEQVETELAAAAVAEEQRIAAEQSDADRVAAEQAAAAQAEADRIAAQQQAEADAAAKAAESKTSTRRSAQADK